MQNPFGFLLLILVSGSGLTAILTVISLLIPEGIERTRAVLQRSLGRSLLLGLINLLCVALIDALFIWLAQLVSNVKVIGGILALLVGLLTLSTAVLALLGLASLANLLGDRMGSPKNEFDATARGGTLLYLAGLTPFIGWFAFTPLALLTGLGAAIQTVFRRKDNMP
jgi:hypothetical protein